MELAATQKVVPITKFMWGNNGGRRNYSFGADNKLSDEPLNKGLNCSYCKVSDRYKYL
jgi:hypothetical protein